MRYCIAVGTVAGLVMSCWRPDYNHCGSNEGDASCPSGMYCDACEPDNNGCVSSPPTMLCHFAGQEPDESSGSEVPTSTGLSEESTGFTTLDITTGESLGDSTTSAAGCVTNVECTDPEIPFCGPSGVCVTCDGLGDPNAANAACEGLDANAPVCFDGNCVQCTDEVADACSGQTPVCGADNACTGCTEHYHCPESACHLDGPSVGACFDVAEVAMVGSSMELSAALGGLAPDGRAVLVLASGTYGVTVDIGSSAEVAILGAGMSSPILTGNGPQSVEAYGNAIVYLANVQISNAAIGGSGLSCSGTSVWLDDSAVTSNGQLGLDVSGCDAHLRRSVVAYNGGGGLDMSGGQLRISTSAIGINGNDLSSIVGGMQLNGTSIEITYSSLVGNEALDGARGSVFCVGGESGVVRNSIVIGAGDSISACEGITFRGSALDTSIAGTNVDVGPTAPAWFVGLGVGDFHLTTAGQMTFAGIALWEPEDPATDIDGDPIDPDQPSTPGYDQP